MRWLKKKEKIGIRHITSGTWYKENKNKNMNRQIIPRRTFLYVVVVLRREFIPIACLQNANAKIVFESWLIINEA